MLKLIASTTIEGGATIELFRTNFGYAVRYGLQVTSNLKLSEARENYYDCFAHALACEGHFAENETA
jgi:hypothetical protein